MAADIDAHGETCDMRRVRQDVDTQDRGLAAQPHRADPQTVEPLDEALFHAGHMRDAAPLVDGPQKGLLANWQA
jgi:hypothetical protein